MGTSPHFFEREGRGTLCRDAKKTIEYAKKYKMGFLKNILTCLKVLLTNRLISDVLPTLESPTTTTLQVTSLAIFLFVIFLL